MKSLSTFLFIFFGGVLSAVVIANAVETLPLSRDFSLAGIENPNEVQTFLETLQSALRANNRQAITEIVRLPMRVSTGAGTLQLNSKKDVLREYDKVFDVDVSRVIACQKFEKLGVTTSGVLIGHGVVYFGLSYQKKKPDPEYKKYSHDVNDRRFWKMQVIGINGGVYAHKQAGLCADSS